MERYEKMITELAPDEIYQPREGITYPAFKKYTYYSAETERETGVNILLPPGYTEEKKYPVVYILHGYFDNEDWMARPVVAIPEMLSNLYADGEAEEMIVVLPYVYCSKTMPFCTGMSLENSLNYDNFINDLIPNLMPFVESRFSLAKGRENTAITGFSMGGRESLFIGFSHPELFGYVGATCPAPGLVKLGDSPAHPGQMPEEGMVIGENDMPILLSYSKSDGVVGRFPESYHNIMEKNGTWHLLHVMEKTGHDHTSVKNHLYNFFRMIFKK